MVPVLVPIVKVDLPRPPNVKVDLPRPPWQMSVLVAPPTMNSGLDTSSYSGRDQHTSKTVKDILRANL